MRRRLLVSLLLLAACGSKAEIQPGTETGPCIDFDCVRNLVCLSDLCVDPDSESETGSDDGSDANPDSDSDSDGGPGPDMSRAVDVLFIVDNTGSMREEQALLAASAPRLVSELEAANVDYRIAVTTTDVGNPWCTATGSEQGRLVLTSCRSRLSDFVFEGATTIDATQEACLDACGLDSLVIEATATDEDATPRPRPWIESEGGVSNVGGGASVAQALQCALPQGINGCGFEAPLEAMRSAFARFDLPSEDSAGFHRSDALLYVVFVTDEADCSYNRDQEIVFLPEGNRVFWSLPDEGSPTSAVCWNAGVKCTGSSPTYDNCVPADYDVDGNELSDADAAANAALHPVSRYTEMAEARGALAAAINGVNADGTVTYQDSLAGTMNDPNYQDNFGIGPGCASIVAEAVPPVRVRALVEELDNGPNLYSICNTSYEDALEAIAATIVAQLPQ